VLMINEYRYSFAKLKNSYIRAFIGFNICLSPFFLGAEMVGIVPFLIGLGFVFALYGLRTLLWHNLRVTTDEKKITVNLPFPKIIYWDAVTDVTVSCFTSWRGSNITWAQLCIHGINKKMYLESSLSDFDRILQRVIAAAKVNNLVLKPSTLLNLEASNIDISDFRSTE
jgi:hypothetical protein